MHNTFIKFFTDLFNTLIKCIKYLFNTFINIFTDLFNTLINIFTYLFNRLKNFFTYLFNYKRNLLYTLILNFIFLVLWVNFTEMNMYWDIRLYFSRDSFLEHILLFFNPDLYKDLNSILSIFKLNINIELILVIIWCLIQICIFLPINVYFFLSILFLLIFTYCFIIMIFYDTIDIQILGLIITNLPIKDINLCMYINYLYILFNFFSLDPKEVYILSDLDLGVLTHYIISLNTQDIDVINKICITYFQEHNQIQLLSDSLFWKRYEGHLEAADRWYGILKFLGLLFFFMHDTQFVINEHNIWQHLANVVLRSTIADFVFCEVSNFHLLLPLPLYSDWYTNFDWWIFHNYEALRPRISINRLSLDVLYDTGIHNIITSKTQAELLMLYENELKIDPNLRMTLIDMMKPKESLDIDPNDIKDWYDTNK